LNNIKIIEDSTKKRISLNLPEIDDINSLEHIIPKTPKSSKPPELPAPRLSKPLEPENKPLEPMLRLSEKPIKPMDSLDPDEIQLDLVTSLCYRVKTKIFKKKLDKNNSTLNIYKQALKSLNVKKWLTTIFNEFKQLISSKTLKFLLYKVLLKGKKLLTNRLVFKEKKDQYNITIKFKM